MNTIDPRLETVIRKIESGELTEACIYELLDTYYQLVIWKSDNSDCEDDLQDAETPFPEDFLLPVDDRSSGIGAALTQLLAAGHDVDGTDGYSNALMIAVGNGDAPMVHFLLQHGANAESWPMMDDDLTGHNSNYYLEDIDINFMNECYANDRDPDYLQALYRTALVLVEDAHLGPYSGYCLKIDNDGNVTLEPAKLLF